MSDTQPIAAAPDLPIGTYRHYKGGTYQVLMLACDEATHQWLVIYKALYDTGGMPTIWARTYDIFTSDVEWEGKLTKRFKHVGGR